MSDHNHKMIAEAWPIEVLLASDSEFVASTADALINAAQIAGLAKGKAVNQARCCGVCDKPWSRSRMPVYVVTMKCLRGRIKFLESETTGMLSLVCNCCIDERGPDECQMMLVKEAATYGEDSRITVVSEEGHG